MSTPAVRLGILGCGFATQSRHLPALKRTAGIEVVALCDADPARLARVAADWRVGRRYREPQALLDDPDLDAVAVCTPAEHHVPLALAALAAERHVFVEKPLALSLEDADRLAERAASSVRRVLVGFNLRWHRLAMRAHDLLAAGGIGRVRAVRSVFSDPLLTRADLPEWRRRRAQGGGSLLDKGVHHFDLWRYLLDDEVETVAAASASGGADDEVAAVTARTASGVVLTALTMDATTVGNEMTLYGDGGTLHLDLYRADGYELRAPHDLPGSPASRLRRLAASFSELGANAGEMARGGVFDAAYERQWRHFVDVVRHGVAPACTVRDGRAALAIALAAIAAAGDGGTRQVAAETPRGHAAAAG